MAHDTVTSFRTKRTDAITPEHFTRISVWLDDVDFLVEAYNPFVQHFGLSLGLSETSCHLHLFFFQTLPSQMHTKLFQADLCDSNFDFEHVT